MGNCFGVQQQEPGKSHENSRNYNTIDGVTRHGAHPQNYPREVRSGSEPPFAQNSSQHKVQNWHGPGHRSRPPQNQNYYNQGNIAVQSEHYPTRSASPPRTTTSPQLKQLLDHFLKQAIKEALSRHKDTLLQVTDKQVPFTDTQITDYHRDTRKAVMRAFKETFIDLYRAYPEILIQFSKKLDQEIQAQLIVYLKRYENTIEDVKRRINTLELEAENLYDTSMEAFEGEHGALVSVRDYEAKHNKTADETRSELKEKIQRHELNMEHFPRMDRQLQYKLKEKLKDRLKELIDDGSVDEV